MLVSKNAQICVTLNANPEICITPNANPQHEQVEYRWRLVPNARSWHWACRFHVVYFLLPCVGYSMRIQFPTEYRLKGAFHRRYFHKYASPYMKIEKICIALLVFMILEYYKKKEVTEREREIGIYDLKV